MTKKKQKTKRKIDLFTKFLMLAKKDWESGYKIEINEDGTEVRVCSYRAAGFFGDDGEIFSVEGKNLKDCIRKAVKNLEEEVGKLTKDDIKEYSRKPRELTGKEFLEDMKENIERIGREVQLQEVVDRLSKKYNGKHGEPKFIVEEVRDYLSSLYGDDVDNWPEKVDLEKAYLSFYKKGKNYGRKAKKRRKIGKGRKI